MTTATVAAPAPKPKAFAVRFRELERWSVGSFIALDWRWPRKMIRPLAEALHRKSVDVDRKTTDAEALKLITLHFDGEIEPRQQRGTKTVKGRDRKGGPEKGIRTGKGDKYIFLGVRGWGQGGGGYRWDRITVMQYAQVGRPRRAGALESPIGW